MELNIPTWAVKQTRVANKDFIQAVFVGDLGSIPELGRSPGEGHGDPLQYSCLENPPGQRSLVGCNPWGRKGSDTTEQLSITQHICCYSSISLSVYFLVFGGRPADLYSFLLLCNFLPHFPISASSLLYLSIL